MGPVGREQPPANEPAPTYFGQSIPSVDAYRYLGVLLDVQLDFQQHLASMIARGWSEFNALLGTLNSYQIPLPLFGTQTHGAILGPILTSEHDFRRHLDS